ncbi:MAG: hypothetical protein R6V58_08205 [Planctomycetota bacterium]
MLNDELISLCAALADQLQSTTPLVIDPTYVDAELQEPVSACDLLSSIQQPVKDVIVGLELIGRDEEASNIEARFVDVRGMCEGFDGNREEPRRYRNELEEAASCLSGALEDLMVELSDDE